MFAGQNRARQFAAVMVEAHVETGRAHPRTLPGRALPAAEQPADTGKAAGAERRPAEQAGAENAERDRDRQFAPHARIGGNRQRNDTTADLDCARQHRRIGGAEHLEQQIKRDNGDDASDQGHGVNIVALLSKSMVSFPPSTIGR